MIWKGSAWAGWKPTPLVYSGLGGAEAPRGLKSALQDGAGARGDVAIFQAFEFFSGHLGGFDGGVV